MIIRVATRHGHLSESSQEAVKERAEKLTRYFDRLTSIEFVIDLKDSTSPKVDLNVSAEHKHDFVAHDQSENLMSSVDAVVQKLEQQLRRYKEKVQTRNRKPESKRSEPHGLRGDVDLSNEALADETLADETLADGALADGALADEAMEPEEG